ncbi:uncharacterized protein LOC115444933 [Manduca sexta]|uniref:DUF243 domain-containing protein n=1 Tax=Manduca sexta TaxID=7130 RepID=A0A921Z7D1_MANSE|nr:uncharacterized protein LOC115444933 [Manduca sexta]KAG6452309.1 hypothetical protein O3G_MSEX007553 [Manduca sexta]KAG6452310.1 hypothetical protein O3G_MSEX007553 [Manduca sexta]
MNTLWVLATILAVASADVSLGYHYKVPETSYGVPSYQFGESAGHSSALSGSIGSSSSFDYKSQGSSLGHHGSSNILSQSGLSSSGLHHGGISGLNSGLSSGVHYPSFSASSGSSSSYYPHSSGSSSSGQYFPSSFGSGSSIGSTVRPLVHSGDVSHSAPSYSQYQNNYQNAAAYKYQQFYVQQQPAQVYKHFYVHSAPEEPEEAKPRQPIVLPPPQKHYKIIFVKTPTQQAQAPQVVAVPQQNEEKTIVYVLSKKQEQQPAEVILPKIEQKPPSKPEVYFIKYKNKEDQSVISDIVNDYNKGQSQVSFSGIGDEGHADHDSSSQSSFGVGSNGYFGSGSQGAVGSGSHSIFGSSSHSAPSVSHGHYSQQHSVTPVELSVPVSGFGSNSFDVSHSSSGAQSFSLGSTESSNLSDVSSVPLVGVPESSTSASAIASSGHVSSTASSVSYDDSNLISTSQGVPHETYGPPKFRINN